MDPKKRNKLESAGWRVSSAQEFLGLTPDEVALIDVRLSVSSLVRSARERAGLSQQALARRLGSSQSRVAKLEAGDAGVSLDLMVRAAFAAGARKSDLARAISDKQRVALGGRDA